MAIVRVRESCVVTVDGVPVSLKIDTPYRDDDPVVRAHPDVFISDVEEATARPGERRNTRRS